MTEKIIIAGSGGQGIMLLGKVLAYAAMEENKFVTWLPAYGAEVRGGAAHCTVIISDEEIGSPCASKADTMIIMNQPSFVKFKKRLSSKGLLVLNSSLVEFGRDKFVRAVKFPFTDIAVDLGNVKVANMVALGTFVAKKKTVGIKSIFTAMERIAPASSKGLIEINQQALLKGAGLING
ncbi:MAG: 2-oxoacid:acceptor oxidoreductase family protein [Candidatus Omnitrophica bacterium]|jgi:2-oxoglutarate ferredoxin oxidoreductase subunit gamma|nr:2-oxoacid:acceptor oxidoreductase family protein [Candidatus Omnitrophota bacterium]